VLTGAYYTPGVFTYSWNVTVGDATSQELVYYSYPDDRKVSRSCTVHA